MLSQKGTFTQSVLRSVIRRRLGYLINKNVFFTYKTTILRGEFCPSVNATLAKYLSCTVREDKVVFYFGCVCLSPKVHLPTRGTAHYCRCT